MQQDIWERVSSGEAQTDTQRRAQIRLHNLR